MTTNQRTPNPNILYVWCGVVILILAIIAALGSRERKIPDFQSELYSLPVTATAADLEKMGYVNLTQVQPTYVGKVESFFTNTDVGALLLKTFTETEDELIVRVFLCNRGARFVQMYTYYVQRQVQEGAPTFYIQSDRVETADGITEVWLRGHTPIVGDPIPEDFLLYRFTTPQ